MDNAILGSVVAGVVMLFVGFLLKGAISYSPDKRWIEQAIETANNIAKENATTLLRVLLATEKLKSRTNVLRKDISNVKQQIEKLQTRNDTKDSR